MCDLNITICVPTDAAYYGDAPDDEIQTLAANMLDVMTLYAEQEWPEAGVEGRLVPECLSLNNRTSAIDDDGDREDIVESLGCLADRIYTDGELFEEEFDAEAYVAARLTSVHD